MNIIEKSTQGGIGSLAVRAFIDEIMKNILSYHKENLGKPIPIDENLIISDIDWYKGIRERLKETRFSEIKSETKKRFQTFDIVRAAHKKEIEKL